MQKKSMKYSLYLLRMLLLATCLWSLTAAPRRSRRSSCNPIGWSGNLYLASVMSVSTRGSATLQGRGFEAGDLPVAPRRGSAVEMPVGDVDQPRRHELPFAGGAGPRHLMEVYVVRGSEGAVCHHGPDLP